MVCDAQRTFLGHFRYSCAALIERDERHSSITATVAVALWLGQELRFEEQVLTAFARISLRGHRKQNTEVTRHITSSDIQHCWTLILSGDFADIALYLAHRYYPTLAVERLPQIHGPPLRETCERQQQNRIIMLCWGTHLAWHGQTSNWRTIALSRCEMDKARRANVIITRRRKMLSTATRSSLDPFQCLT